MKFTNTEYTIYVNDNGLKFMIGNSNILVLFISTFLKEY